MRRDPDGVELRTGDDALRRFDAVVVATHADQALELLEDPTRRRAQAARHVRVHAQRGHAAHRRVAPAGDAGRPGLVELPAPATTASPTVTYYLNRLQRLDTDRDWCVTLNGEVAEEHVVERTVFEHPLFTRRAPSPRSVSCRGSRGVRRTWYAGAYHGNGFHEDGLASGVRAAESLGASW